MEVDDAVAEAPLVHQLELDVDPGGQRALAAAREDRSEEEVALVDQTGGDRLAREVRAADRDVGSCALLQARDDGSVELALDRVRSLDTVCSVRENTIFSAARQVSA